MIGRFGLALCLVLLLPGLAAAQAELQSLLSSDLDRQMPRADYRILYYSNERVANQPTHLGFTDHRVSLTLPLWGDSRDSATFFTNADLEDFRTKAVLPDSGRRFPGELWDVRLGGTYRHKFDNNWIGGASLTVGSASDKPFHSTDELIARGFAFLRIPHRETNAWLFSLAYANDAEFLGGVPVPGIAYLYAPSENFHAVIGVPFSAIEYRPFEKLTLEASYVPVRRVRARATYVMFRPLRLWAGFDWDNERHFLADRHDKDDKLFYYEKRLSGGIRFDLRHVGLEVYGGRTFDRFYFEGESYSDRHDNRIDIHDGWFAAARLSARF